MNRPLFQLNATLDLDRFAKRYAAAGRVHIPNFLEEAATRALLQELRAREDWKLLINQGDKVFELDRVAQLALSKQKRETLDAAVDAAARHDFQYRYESLRVPDGRTARLAQPTLLSAFAQFMNSPEVITALEVVTGSSAICFADAQATAYGPHHFLTEHDDNVEGKDRVAAYVLNLTPDWRADWGGLLAFHDADGHVEQAYTPRFNALNLLSVPQRHSVTYVTPFVPNRRYSVTGWLRSSPPPP